MPPSQFTSSNNQQRSSTGASASAPPQRLPNPHHQVSSSVSNASDHSMTSSSSSSTIYTSSVPTGRHHRNRTAASASEGRNRMIGPIISESPLNTDELRTINQTRSQINRQLDLDVDRNLFSHPQQIYMNPRLQYFSLSDNFLRFDEFHSYRHSHNNVDSPEGESNLYQHNNLEQSMDGSRRRRLDRSQYSSASSTPFPTPPTNIPPTTSIITEASYITPELRSIPTHTPTHSHSYTPLQPRTNLTPAATTAFTPTMQTVGHPLSSRKRQWTDTNHQSSDSSQPQSHSQHQSSSSRMSLRHRSNSTRSHNNNDNNGSNNNNNTRGLNSNETSKNNASYSSEKRSRK